jgi:hypothetical protein
VDSGSLWSGLRPLVPPEQCPPSTIRPQSEPHYPKYRLVLTVFSVLCLRVL